MRLNKEDIKTLKEASILFQKGSDMVSTVHNRLNSKKRKVPFGVNMMMKSIMNQSSAMAWATEPILLA